MTTEKVKAVEVKKLTTFNGDARLYRLSEPISHSKGDDFLYTSYIVASAVTLDFAFQFIFNELSVPNVETYLFAADEEGEVLDWTELSGSMKGTLNHREVIENAGYELID